MTAAPDLRTFSRGVTTPELASVPRPPRRWFARVVVPLTIVLATAGLVLYTARNLLWQSVDVWVAPVVMKGGGSVGGGATSGTARPQQVLVQAPGWIEADPYAISVPALTTGVVKEVLVLEGQQVEQGQVVATLVDDDARLAQSRSRAELEAVQSELAMAQANYDAAVTRAAEVRDEVERKRELVAAGGISEGQFARLELRLRSMDQEIASAQAAVKAAGARVRQHEVACDEADLAMERTQVRAPAAGVVLARLVEPGTRISMEGNMPGAVVRLYDPSKLQVRVDVPIAEAAKVGVGTPASIVTEALPDTVFNGTVTRLVHEANIQRNTVQVKVAIENPSATLKPEMLTRVRFLGTPPSGTRSAGGSAAVRMDGDTPSYIIPAAALLHASGGSAQVYVVDNASQEGAVAAMRQVEFTPSSLEGQVEATGALHEGDRVIVEPLDQLKDGRRVRVMGEKANTGSQQGGARAAH